MPRRWRLPIVVLVLVTLGSVAAPPVIENHLEAGFCSADCPVQLAGHGAAVTPPVPAVAIHRAPVVAAACMARAVDDVGTVRLPDAPRAPPSARFD
jgi:hypothetical protein